MSNPNNKTPMILGIIALLVVGGGAAFYFSQNMTKTEERVAQAPVNAGEPAEASPAAGSTGEPPATEEETREAEAAAASFEGVEVEKGNPVVATVDGKDITRVDVFRYIKMMPANVQQLPPQAVYPIALDQVINTRLVQNKAEAAGLENDPEVRQQLDMAAQQIIRTVFVQRAVDKEISDADLKKKYNDMVGKTPAIEEVKAAHILVESEAKAKELIEKLNGGADFAKLASENSADPGNKDQGGELGWFAKQDMVPEFSDAAFKMAKGEISKAPVKTQFGFHVVKVEDKRQRPKPSFEEVKPMIQAEMRREKLEAMLDKWKTAAKVERFDINGKAVSTAATTSDADVAPAAGEAPAADAAE